MLNSFYSDSFVDHKEKLLNANIEYIKSFNIFLNIVEICSNIFDYVGKSISY